MPAALACTVRRCTEERCSFYAQVYLCVRASSGYEPSQTNMRYTHVRPTYAICFSYCFMSVCLSILSQLYLSPQRQKRDTIYPSPNKGRVKISPRIVFASSVHLLDSGHITVATQFTEQDGRGQKRKISTNKKFFLSKTKLCFSGTGRNIKFIFLRSI